MDIYT